MRGSTREVMDGDERASREFLERCTGAIRGAGQVAEVSAGVFQGQHVQVKLFPVHSHQDVAVLACLPHSLQPSVEVLLLGHGTLWAPLDSPTLPT
jgi:hypothetical protein